MSLLKLEVLGRIAQSGLVAIIRTENSGKAARLAEACAQGGAAAVEVTFTVPRAAAIIEDLVQRFPSGEISLGAGTVLDPETARIAILAGAQFIVSPSLNPGTARLCNRYQIPYLPGAGSLREIVESLEAGADIVKVFPGETLGPAFIKAARGPLPQAALMATGGVSLSSAEDWIRAGCVAVGVGGSLTNAVRGDDYKPVADLARRFLEVIRAARSARQSA